MRFSGLLGVSLASEINQRRIEWLWPNRFPLGKLSIIAGLPDTGKSQIALGIAATVSTGGDWPNGEGRAEQGGVIIVSHEDDFFDNVILRLEAAGADLDKVVIVKPIVHTLKEGRKIRRVLNIEDDLAMIADLIKHCAARGIVIRLIVFDPLTAYFGRASKTADMRAMLAPLVEWCSNRKIAVVGVSTFNELDNARALTRIMDSGAITAVSRVVWTAVRKSKTQLELLRG